MVKPYIAAHPLRIISNLLYGIKVNKFINLKNVNILYYSAGSLWLAVPELINHCVEKRIQNSQSKAPAALEQWPLLFNSKLLPGHSERGRQRQTDRWLCWWEWKFEGRGLFVNRQRWRKSLIFAVPFFFNLLPIINEIEVLISLSHNKSFINHSYNWKNVKLLLHLAIILWAATTYTKLTIFQEYVGKENTDDFHSWVGWLSDSQKQAKLEWSRTKRQQKHAKSVKRKTEASLQDPAWNYTL